MDSGSSTRKLLENKRQMSTYHDSLEESSNVVRKNGSISVFTALFSCSPETVSRIWKRGPESIPAGSVLTDISSHKKINSGRRRRDPEEIRRQGVLLFYEVEARFGAYLLHLLYLNRRGFRFVTEVLLSQLWHQITKYQDPIFAFHS